MERKSTAPTYTTYPVWELDDTTTNEENRELRRVESHLGDQDDFSSSHDTTSFSNKKDSTSEVSSEGTDEGNQVESSSNTFLFFVLFDSISFGTRSIHVLCSHHNNPCKQSVPRFPPLYTIFR